VRLTHEGLETFPKLPAFASEFRGGLDRDRRTSLKNFVEGRHAGEMILTRVFDAPRELIWKLWTSPSTSANGGDRRLHAPGCEMVPHGGAYRFVMRAPDGRTSVSRVYARSANERIVSPPVLDNLRQRAADDGDVADEGGKTKLTVRQTTPPVRPAAARPGLERDPRALADCLARPSEFSNSIARSNFRRIGARVDFGGPVRRRV